MPKHKEKKEFNILIVGIGGQGLVTLIKILAEAALTEGFDFKTSELHGLAQREGSAEAHLRLGEKIYSPLICQGEANLIIVLEAQEVFRACRYASNKRRTVFVINDFIKSIPGVRKTPTVREILGDLKNFSKKIILIPASKICIKEFGTDVVSGVSLVGLASFKNLMPLKPGSILKIISKVIPKKYRLLNTKAFNLFKGQQAAKEKDRRKLLSRKIQK